MRLSAKHNVFRVSIFAFFFFSHVQADWSGEAYGGRYYDDRRLGNYLVYSSTNPGGGTAIAEVLYESYKDYEFAGIGGHFLWPVTTSVEAGIVISRAWERYESSGFDEIDYRTGTVGMELEYNSDQITLAAQSGKYFSDYDYTNSMYLSADLYYLGSDYNWYLRAATRWVSNDSVHFVEAYRSSYLLNFPFTAYLGLSAEYSNNDSYSAIDSVYTGAYIELFSLPSSALFLWSEIAELDGDTLFTIELSLVFGPGARTPYITAFGSSLTD